MPFRRKRHHNPNNAHGTKAISAARVEQLLYGQPIPDQYQCERLEQARKENQMPDLQSELSKLANAWDHHEQEIRQPKQEKAMQPQYTGNMSRDTFNFIKANPAAYTQKGACTALTNMGYKKSSVHAIITQMKRAKIMALNVDGELFTLQDEYKPFANPYKANPAGGVKKTRRVKVVKPAKPAKPAKVLAPKSAGIAALQADTTPVPVALPNLPTAESVLANIGVAEAFKLYEALSQMFGGK